MRWAASNRPSTEYYVFVEDDSFICTENLIHQALLLYNRSSLLSDRVQPTLPPQSFRAGTSMYDGFDDSSTIMTKYGLAFTSYTL